MMTMKRSAEKTVRDIRRATQRHYSADEISVLYLEGVFGEDSIAELCRREGINTNVFYGRGQSILDQREAIKLNTLALRRKMHYDSRNNLNLMS